MIRMTVPTEIIYKFSDENEGETGTCDVSLISLENGQNKFILKKQQMKDGLDAFSC